MPSSELVFLKIITSLKRSYVELNLSVMLEFMQMALLMGMKISNLRISSRSLEMTKLVIILSKLLMMRLFSGRNCNTNPISIEHLTNNISNKKDNSVIPI